jgi:toxin FitB
MFFLSYGNRVRTPVVAWVNDQQEEQLFLSAVTLGELQAGIERTRRQDPLKASEIEL